MRAIGKGLMLALSLSIFLWGCSDHAEKEKQAITLDSFQEWTDNVYSIVPQKIRGNIYTLRRSMQDSMYADRQASAYYAKDSAFLWVNRQGLTTQADSLLPWLERVTEMGFSEERFYVQPIKDDLSKLRDLNFTAQDDVNKIMARLEYKLTRACNRYACGQRFGFVNPRRVLNTFEKRDTSKNARYVMLFDAAMELPDSAFLQQIRNNVRANEVGRFLREIQPTDSLYYRYLNGYQQHKGDASAQKWLVNLERSRWRPKLKKEKKYVLVNIPAFALEAIDQDNDTCITMRICCGRKANKTPLLNSRISHLELNPYWIVPKNIIQKEIAPRHACDVGYFTRNRMKIVNKRTKEEIPPSMATTDILLSNAYWLRQDNGAGNSLGRMIFRFPNNFSVYLHDTTNKGAFAQSWRGVSHGCIRLEHPLDLAVFLLHEKDEMLIDKIRISIDKEPLTEKGQELAQQTKRPLGNHSFKPTIPLFIVYYTIYPEKPGGAMHQYSDVYGYDKAIWERLRFF